MSKVSSMFAVSYERTLCYMLQASEYSLPEFWRWWRQTKDFRRVSDRGGLVETSFGKLLYLFAGTASIAILAACGILVGLSIIKFGWSWLAAGVLVFVLRPFLVTLVTVMAVAVGNKWYIQPQLRQKIAEATRTFSKHPGTKIAVLGSYGKTTMKELLATVLSEGLDVAATPATKNVAVSHAAFARSLTGDEKVVILEFGEGRPGDTKLFTDMFQPDYAVVTGLAPAHLDAYGSLDAVAADFAYVAGKVAPEKTYINGSDAGLSAAFPKSQKYSAAGAGAWKVSGVAVTPHGLTFDLSAKAKKMHVRSGLLGRHQVGPLSAAAALAAELGLPPKTIQAGLANTVPYEHRMQPRAIGGALLIDDTYNGNIEGIKAGIALLKDLPAKRRIYVTPGLVEQGAETEAVHVQIGTLLSKAGFDEIVLMKNTMTAHIESALQKAGYKGRVTIEDKPLQYYQNIEYHAAAGDVIMMQNDLPDRYM